ncbi:unnamed protein product [Urochloa decumbens]|uniref:Uncharacterized protein n=1 Tax=Urochloa decumbens TaxID=240449 RepID=A0ABC9BMU0_9POAL
MAAAAVASVSMGVMKPVLAKLTTLMGNKYKKIKGLRKMVTFLQRELRDMEALLEKMDSADELDPQAKNWREDIIEMSYNIEDCIDDFMQRVGQADNKVGILRKASRYLKTFKDRCRLANQFEEIKAKVMEASERRKRYMLGQSISIVAPVPIDPRLSAIYKESTSLVGIDRQKTELVNWVKDNEKQLKVMAIVGFGGLGKTTLANEVYLGVAAEFDCKAFVSVSQKPEMIGLFNSLLCQLGLDTYSHACQLQDPINKLRTYLKRKRYFIVVDDLWDTQAWETIKCAFPPNEEHARVMITTRNDYLARSCCGKHGHIHNMTPLSEEDSKKLFFNRIFGSKDACPSELSKASSEILKKCDGMPLAIITMASMLACQQTRLEEQWEYIQNSLATKFSTNSNYEDMMYILNLSYKNLPRHLKACFLYLGSYPEDHEIDRVELVRRWVAEGFVSDSSGQDIWDVAESYFNELVNRSMIQPIYDDFVLRTISGCRVHDMLLELIVRRCKEDNFLSLVSDKQAMVEVQEKVIRRLNVVGLQGTKDDKVAVNTVGNVAWIRSLAILGELNWIPSLLEFKFLRVLSLHVSYRHDGAIDLTVINQLSQLRYLMVEGDCRNIMLPFQIQGLRLLETFDFSRTFNYSSISLEIVDAPHLSHLIMPWGTRLPDWIGKMKSLRTLRGFSLPVDSLESIIGLGELTALSELHLVYPNGRAGLVLKATWMTALSSSLDKLCNNLKQLVLGPHGQVALRADALSLLSPRFGKLEMLDLQLGHTFSRVPRWIGHLRNLRSLRLGAKQLLQADVDMIGSRLPSLVDLSLRIPRVLTEKITVKGSTGFPALKRFIFDCDGISFLTFEEGAMPKLQVLELYFNTNELNKVAPSGLQHLPKLLKFTTNEACYSSKWRRRTKPTDGTLIRTVFQEPADAVPTRPTFTHDYLGRKILRPIEEEDYSSEDD